VKNTTVASVSSGWRRISSLGPRLAAGRLWVGLRRTFAERGGLSLAGAQGVVEPPGQLRDLGFEFGHALEEIPIAGTRGFVHAAIVVTEASSRPDQGLIKYRPGLGDG